MNVHGNGSRLRPLALATALPVFSPAQVAEIGRFIQTQLGCP